jgi:hypothetical protein
MLLLLLFGSLGVTLLRETSHLTHFFLICLYRYALPLSVALIAFILRWIADATCSPYSHVCRKSSDLLSHIYAVVMIFLLIVGATKAKQVKELFNKVKSAIQVLSGGDNKQKND